jgi:hypothetical protein
MYRFLQTIFKDLEINYQPLDKENLSRSKEKNGKLICLNSGWLTTQNWTIKYVNLQLENYIGMYFFTNFPTIECSFARKTHNQKNKIGKESGFKLPWPNKSIAFYSFAKYMLHKKIEINQI